MENGKDNGNYYRNIGVIYPGLEFRVEGFGLGRAEPQGDLVSRTMMRVAEVMIRLQEVRSILAKSP